MTLDGESMREHNVPRAGDRDMSDMKLQKLALFALQGAECPACAECAQRSATWGAACMAAPPAINVRGGNLARAMRELCAVKQWRQHKIEEMVERERNGIGRGPNGFSWEVRPTVVAHGGAEVCSR